MGPLTIENYRKRLETSGAAHDLRLPKSGVQVGEQARCMGAPLPAAPLNLRSFSVLLQQIS